MSKDPTPGARLARRAGAAALAALALVLAAGCGGDDDAGSSGSINVVASTTQLADIARNVGGERASVTGILPANADPHEYEPRPSDAESVTDADVILQSGGDLDLWLDELVESSGTDAPVTALLDSVNTIEGTGEDAGESDPHWWQDPTNTISAVETIRDQLIAADPDGRSTYETNADGYIEGLMNLDGEIAKCMKAIPEDERKLVTSHDALGYFADRYDIDVVGAVIPALTTQAQPSAGETQELIDLIEQEDVRAVFPESGVNAELEQTVADETGAAIGDELWADTLGPEDSTGATYLEAMRHNANALAAGFTGDPAACAVGG